MGPIVPGTARRFRTFLALLTLVAATDAVAQNTSRTVRVEGRALFRVWSPSEEAAVDRAARIERRLVLLLDQNRVQERATIRPRGAQREIYVGPILVTAVTPLDAEEELVSADVLAARWAGAIDHGLRQSRHRRLSWGRFASAVAGGIRTAFGRVGESALTIVPRFIAGLLIIASFWFLASLLRGMLGFLLARIRADRTVVSFIKQLVYYAVWIVGLVIALHALGLDPASAVAALGLTSLALGFALKDILSNLVSGILMLALRPFEIGDQIVVGETEGSVERIRLRATHIRTYDGRLVQVPNAELFTSRITNNTASPQRRTSVAIPIGYDVDVRRALELAGEAARGTEGVSSTQRTIARIRDLGGSDMLLEVQFWTDSPRADVVGTAAEVRRSIVAAFQTERISLPDPAKRVVTMRDERGA